MSDYLYEKINEELLCVNEQCTGKLGVLFRDLNNGNSVSLNQTEIFPSASTFKLLILLELYRQVAAGTLDSSVRYTISPNYRSMGSGIIRNFSKGYALTLFDYALMMISISDNTCADFLLDLVGKENIYNNVIKGLNLTNTKLDFSCSEIFINYCNASEADTPLQIMSKYSQGDFRNAQYLSCQTTQNNVSTPRDMAVILDTLYNNRWVSEKVCQQILLTLKRCRTKTRIPKYLPNGTVVAHKTGTFDRVSNDIGIVYTGSGNYIISLFYNGNVASEDEYYNININGAFGDDLLAHLSKKIFYLYTSHI